MAKFQALFLVIFFIAGSSISSISGRCWWTQCQSAAEEDYCPAGAQVTVSTVQGCDDEFVNVQCCTEDQSGGGQGGFGGQQMFVGDGGQYGQQGGQYGQPARPSQQQYDEMGEY